MDQFHITQGFPEKQTQLDIGREIERISKFIKKKSTYRILAEEPLILQFASS